VRIGRLVVMLERADADFLLTPAIVLTALEDGAFAYLGIEGRWGRSVLSISIHTACAPAFPRALSTFLIRLAGYSPSLKT
jgi:hypothetical protein